MTTGVWGRPRSRASRATWAASGLYPVRHVPFYDRPIGLFDPSKVADEEPSRTASPTTDIARVILLAAVTDEAFNKGTGVEPSLFEQALALLHRSGSALAVEFGPPRAVNLGPRRLAGADPGCERLGGRAGVNLEEWLREVVVRWQAQTEPKAKQ